MNDNLGFASIPAVNQYLQLAKEQKIDIKQIMHDIGVSVELLEDNSQHITGKQFQDLIACLLMSV